ncbi:histidine kinase [Isoptericola halotolerans]|uniref:histidine kinase n=1 Tax=Isoptericola halotolerans TaxID=300560 RepID=A0ABX5EK90_9MICO|nr:MULTISPECIES: histidine kinase [Isoptericola]PRZ08541.1 histidine kinase [Isoptericola halotolerans]
MPTPTDDPYRPDPAVLDTDPAARDRARTRGVWRRVWGETWRLAVALVFSTIVFGGMAVEAESAQQPISEQQVALDVLVGLVCFGLVLLRRRWPTTIALLVCAGAAVSVLAVGPVALAVVSLATHRQWWRIVAVGVVYVLSGWTYERLYPPVDSVGWPVALGGGVVLYSLMVWIGAYIGLRREYLAGLHERIATAEREQASRVAQARANERARIAREMHDVLAHRMSLVAMHAGALAYRTDLPREQVAETAALVRDSAHAALGELREVLGVLRGLDGPPAGAVGGPHAADPERPQPTLVDLPALARSTTDAGTPVRLEDRRDSPEKLPTAASRTAYRIVQEALTNVRKHAPELSASVVLHGAPGQGLWITVTNPTALTDAGGDDAPSVPPSGLGLLGLTERAELAGGTLTARATDGRFTLRAWLPWAP